jgi:hypothetical protein
LELGRSIPLELRDFNVTAVDAQGDVSGTIQLTANVTNNIYGTWDETDQIFNFFFPYPSLVIDRHRYVGYLFQSSEPLFKGSLQPPGSPS